MSTRVTINIGFYFEKEHYAQLQAYIPRSEALAIPQLQTEQQERIGRKDPEQIDYRTRQGRSDRKDSDDQSEEEDNNPANDMENQNEIDNEMENENENEDDNEIDPDQQNEVERALQELDQEDNFDSESSSQEQDEDDDLDDLSSLSNQSPAKGYSKTKRQKGETKDLVQLPDRRPRNDKKLDQATEIIRREQKQRKRKQYLKKQVEAQEKATLDKILNQTGRKLRMRQEKEIQDEIDREQKVYKTLGNVPKIITLINEQGRTILIHKTPLFPPSMTSSPDLKMRQLCTHCGHSSKYTLKGGARFACSLPCYKAIASQ